MQEYNWFDIIGAQGNSITQDQRKQIEDKLNKVLSYEPKVGVFGKTGVGKSSLCNALFGQDVCPISDVEACTRAPQEIILNMGNKGIKLLDVPGVGENQERDEEYAKLYSKLLPELDLVLWLIKADDRAMASDENFYKNIVMPHIEQGKTFFFVVNQVDKIEPFREWNIANHEPGPQQYQNIGRKVDAIATQFNVPASKVIPVSAEEKYNLIKLVDEIVFALPKEKNITVFKAVSKEFKSAAAGEHVRKSLLEVVSETFNHVIDRVADTVDRVVDRIVDHILDKIDNWNPFDRLPFPF